MKSHPTKTSIVLLDSRQEQFQHATATVWGFIVEHADAVGGYALVALVWGLVIYGLAAAMQ